MSKMKNAIQYYVLQKTLIDTYSKTTQIMKLTSLLLDKNMLFESILFIIRIEDLVKKKCFILNNNSWNIRATLYRLLESKKQFTILYCTPMIYNWIKEIITKIKEWHKPNAISFLQL